MVCFILPTRFRRILEHPKCKKCFLCLFTPFLLMDGLRGFWVTLEESRWRLIPTVLTMWFNHMLSSAPLLTLGSSPTQFSVLGIFYSLWYLSIYVPILGFSPTTDFEIVLKLKCVTCRENHDGTKWIEMPQKSTSRWSHLTVKFQLQWPLASGEGALQITTAVFIHSWDVMQCLRN